MLLICPFPLPIFFNERPRLTAIVLAPSEAYHEEPSSKARLGKYLYERENGLGVIETTHGYLGTWSLSAKIRKKSGQIRKILPENEGGKS